MNFASQVLAADGRAALALVVALIEHLEKSETLIPKDRQDIIESARKLVPQGPENINKETRALLAAL